MGKPQMGILPETPENAIFVILRVPELGAGASLVHLAQAGLAVPQVAELVAAKDPKAQVSANVAYSSALWDALSPGKRPKHLRPFAPIAGPHHTAPATGGDVLLHILSSRRDLAAEVLMGAMKGFRDRALVDQEIHGFAFQKSFDFKQDGMRTRDLTGFIDGTENPQGDTERAEAGLIGADDPDFAGGSYVVTQRYVHDLGSWRNIPDAAQETIVGREKNDSTELTGAAKHPRAHISRSVIEENGAELEILRHSFPYVTASEAGLFFVAYTRDLSIPEKMLARMLGTSGDDLTDLLMDYTRPVSGATFFAPSLEWLHKVA